MPAAVTLEEPFADLLQTYITPPPFRGPPSRPSLSHAGAHQENGELFCSSVLRLQHGRAEKDILYRSNLIKAYPHSSVCLSYFESRLVPSMRSSLPLGAWLVLRVHAQNTRSENTTVDALVGWEAGPNTRGTLTLVWSCVITIFACTWAVLHLNVPGLDDTTFQRLARKIKWMVISILFPELILSKAVCDLRLSLEELREFDENLAEIGPITWTTGTLPRRKYEWRWKVKYPKYSGMLYRLLGLKPPCERFSTGSMTHQDTEIADDSGIRMDVAQTSGRTHNDSLANVAEPGQNKEASTYGSLLSQLGEPRLKIQEWTAVHSYYAQMGGLVYLYSSWRQSCIVLTATKLTSRFIWDTDEDNGHPLKYLILGEKDIQDKSKADWLVKGLAVLQITWVILSVIMRHMNGLPITQLEIATIAFSVMAAFIYLASWWKPKDVSQPTILTHSLRNNAKRTAVSRMQPLWLRLRSPAKATTKMARESSERSERVPNDLVWMEGDTPLIFVIMSVSSLTFGGLHCLAWNFEFPTRAELICWRVASLVSAILPILALGLNLIISHLSTRIPSGFVSVLRGKLRTLDDRLPPEWWEYVGNPAFEAWGKDAMMALAAAPAASRDWEKRLSDEAIRRTETSRKSDRNDHDLNLVLYGFHLQKKIVRLTKEVLEADESTFGTQYRILMDGWRITGDSWIPWYEIQHDGGKHDAKGISMCVSCQLGGRRSPCLRLWRDYEDFVRHKLDIPAPQPPCVSYSEQLVQVFAESCHGNLTRSEEDFLQACTVASTIVTISSGLIYTAARLTIIALLFTCLRATPAGVYQITPWTKFIRNFS